MRIAMLGTRGAPARYGGFETAVEEVGARLVAAGHDVIVYCRNPGQDADEHRGMTLVNLPAVRRRAVETLSHTAVSVAHLLARRPPDVVFLFNAANAPLLLPLRAAGIPVAVHVDGLEWRRAKWGPHGARYYRWAESASARWSQAVIADSHGIAAHIRAVHGVQSEYIPYGAPIIDPPPDRLAELDVRPRSYHLVVARFEPENHVREIVRGFSASSCRFPLLVVGDGPYSNGYRNRVASAASADPRIRLLGSVWDEPLLDTLYGNTLTYLHGHSVGGTNPSLLRAMGAAAPSIAFDVNFNREVLGSSGVYFQTPTELALLVEAAEARPGPALQQGRLGQADVAQRYRWDDVAAGYERLAERLAGVSTRRGRLSPL